MPKESQTLPANYQPDFEYLPGLLLRLYQERTVSGVIKTFTERIVADRPHAAGMGVWLRENGQPQFIAGEIRTVEDASENYFATPFAQQIAAQVLTSNAPLFAREEREWANYPAWARRAGIVAFYAVPITFGDELYGALLALIRFRFTDAALHEQGLAWVNIFADHLGAMIANARAFEQIEELSRRLAQENDYLREEVQQGTNSDIIGSSSALKNVLSQIEMVAPTDASVLILGESGTGKELIARALHERSRRAKGTLVKVNCASIPRELFESEFFGHARGAFTGAIKDRPGRFELADGGTLFLDEVGEIPLELQSKLLRILQEGTFERVGEDRTRKTDVRIVAATNRELQAEVAAGHFRQDLYYRLSVFPLSLPPLRERRADIEALAQHFLAHSSRRLGRPVPHLNSAHLHQLTNYDWPGNIRELQHVIERAVIIARNGALQFDLKLDAATALTASTPPELTHESPILTYPQLEALEKQNALRALAQTNGKVSGADGAAALLQIKPTTLNSRLKGMGIDRAK
jgi:transcriptional regulator with GAF, ATPase, and Fis domain